MSSEKQLFKLLLTQVENAFRSKFPEYNQPIEEWKGEVIALFREDLLQVSGGTISEKWFYTHVKSNQEKLPRTDTLNLLSNYVGVGSWKQFSYNNSNSYSDDNHIGRRSSLVPKLFVAGCVLILALLLAYLTLTPKYTYQFCFVDENTGNAVKDSSLELLVVDGNHGVWEAVEAACFSGVGRNVTLRVKSRYYQDLEIEREIDSDNYFEKIRLAPDDYAMMIHMFSSRNMRDRNRRRLQLGEMIHDDARIFQLTEEGYGVDVFNKTEFINRMTLPIKGLKNIQILKTEYSEEKIIRMRFVQY